MTLRNPVVAYVAASNMEAHLLRGILQDAGLDAMVEEDVSQVGVWMFGMASQLHRPKIWVNQTDLAQAKQLLDTFEAERANREDSVLAESGTLEVRCEECGAASHFPKSQQGTVQNCPKCQAYVDVGDDDPGFDWH